MTGADVERVAKGLTEAQREMLSSDQRGSRVASAAGHAIYRKGLATIDRKTGRFVATTLGILVRDHLRSLPHDR